MKTAILVLSILASSYSFASTSYSDSLKKLNAALLDESVIAALEGEAVEKVEIGGDDNLDVKITSKSCQTIIGLTPVVSNRSMIDVVSGRSVIDYKVQNLAKCE